MKVYISADIEGVACIAAPTETDMGSPEYTCFREQMTAEASAACAGAFDGGVEAITVKDAHWTGRNIDPRKLTTPDGRALALIRGWSGHPFSMVEGLDRTFDLVAFVGYHSAAGRSGNPLAHTVSGRLFSKIELNGVCASEFYLFALAAGSIGVPVAFLSGDKALCDEAGALVEGIITVPTLEGFGPSVRSLLPSEAVNRIRDGVRTAVTRRLPNPMTLPPPSLSSSNSPSRARRTRGRSIQESGRYLIASSCWKPTAIWMSSRSSRSHPACREVPATWDPMLPMR